MSQLAFIDLQAQQSIIREEIESRIQNVLDHGSYIMGPEVFELEKKLADFVGVKHCITVSSGTDALLMALMAYDVGPGDAIFTTPFTFIATAEVISLLGATPVFVDIDPATYNIDPEKLEQTIQEFLEDSGTKLRARGIIPVNLFGLPADYSRINEVARKNGLFVIEDAAQGFGGGIDDKRAGSFGDISTISFFPAKPLGCYGDGGAILTDNDQLTNILKSLRVHGKGANKYENIRIGLNGRLDTIQAAVLLSKLEVFTSELEARQIVAESYCAQLKGLNGIHLPEVPDGYRSAWAQFTLQLKERDKLQSLLKKAEIPTAVYYPKPLHLQTAYRGLGHKLGDFPCAEGASMHVLSLPMHPYLKKSDIERICTKISDILVAY